MSEAWPPCPFRAGARYRVKQTFTAMRDRFEAGELLTYRSCAWSRYDSITGYFFVQDGSDATRIWDVGDDESVEQWRELFEPLEL